MYRQNTQWLSCQPNSLTETNSLLKVISSVVSSWTSVSSGLKSATICVRMYYIYCMYCKHYMYCMIACNGGWMGLGTGVGFVRSHLFMVRPGNWYRFTVGIKLEGGSAPRTAIASLWPDNNILLWYTTFYASLTRFTANDNGNYLTRDKLYSLTNHDFSRRYLPTNCLVAVPPWTIPN